MSIYKTDKSCLQTIALLYNELQSAIMCLVFCMCHGADPPPHTRHSVCIQVA